jgi:hypothetical protein
MTRAQTQELLLREKPDEPSVPELSEPKADGSPKPALCEQTPQLERLGRTHDSFFSILCRYEKEISPMTGLCLPP